MSAESDAPGLHVSPATESVSERSGPRHPTSFDRFMFAALIPALLLPPLAVVATWLGEMNRGMGDAQIVALVVGVFMFTQLGSQVLNAWLVLRRPTSFHSRALPRNLSTMHAIMYGVLIAWAIVLYAFPETGASLAFGGVLAILGIVGLSIILGARMSDRAHPVTVPPRSFRLSTTARLLTWAYIVAAGAGLTFSAVVTLTTDASDVSLPPIAGVAAFILVLLGLPWSHTLYGIVFIATIFSAPELQQLPVVLIVLAVPVLVNMAIAVTLLFFPAHRQRLIVWFFRLAPQRRRTVASDDAIAEGSAVDGSAVDDSAV